MAGTEAWLAGQNPYGKLSAELRAGAFGYPPTALPWLALFVPLGMFGFYVWTALELWGWWLLIRERCRSQLLLLFWSPMVLHLVEGQNSLAMVLVLWGAFRAQKRGWLWGFALAWTLTKPQVALIPLIWLLWLDRGAVLRWQLWGGIVLGTILLALPATIMNPAIWSEWLLSLSAYRSRILQMAAWQNFGIVVLLLAGYLWHRSHYGGWHWWLAAAIFPQTSFYAMVALLPTLRPRQNNWTLAGLGLAGILQGPMTPITLPLILAGHLIAGWMIGGGRDERKSARVPLATKRPAIP